ncbi:MAG: tetratricopeptide repeat protein [Treponema sp.]
MNNSDDFNTVSGGANKRSAKKRAKAIAGVAGGTAAALILLFGVRTCKAQAGDQTAKARRNTLELAKMYMERAQYDRALDKLDELLIQNRNDEEARALMEQILAAKGRGSGADGISSDGSADADETSGRGGAYGRTGNAQVSGGNGQSDGTENGGGTAGTGRQGQDGSQSSGLTRRGRGDLLDEAESGGQRSGQNRSNNKNDSGNGASSSRNGNAQSSSTADGRRGAIARQGNDGSSADAKKNADGGSGKQNGAGNADGKSQSQREEEAAQQRAIEAGRKKEETARKEAEQELARRNANVKNEVNAVNDSIEKGKAALKSGNAEEAIKNFRAAEKGLPISAGEPSFSAGKYSEIASALYDSAQKAASPSEKEILSEKAAEYAEKAVAANPKDASSHFILGMNAYGKGNYAKAGASFQKAAAEDKKNYVYFYNLGRAQFMAKKYADAKSSFAKTAELNARFAPARYNLALTNLKLGDEAAALSSFRNARDIDPRYEKAYLEEARLLFRQKDYAGSEAAYENVLKINGKNRTALQELGTLYYQTEKYADSENAFKKSLALLPAGSADPLTSHNLSAVLAAQNKTAEALSSAKTAYDARGMLKDSALQVNVMYNYALLLDKSGRTAEAFTKYSEVLALSPNHVKSKINLGVLEMAKNPPNADGALSFFLAAYAEEKNNFEVNNNLGSAYLAKKDYQNSILYFQNAIALENANTEARSNLAKAFAGAGQYENAKAALTDVLQRSPSDWESYVELAKVYIALKDNAGAETCLKEVKAKQPEFKRAEVESLLKSITE